MGEFIHTFKTPKYLWKPFYGWSMITATLTNPDEYKVATQFLVRTKEGGLQIIDTIDQVTLPVATMRYSQDYTLAAIGLKKNQQDTCKLWLYRVVPKKKK